MGKSRHIDDVFYLAGRRVDPEREQFDLMFVCSAVEEEEIAQMKKNFLGFNINQPAEYLKGASFEEIITLAADFQADVNASELPGSSADTSTK